MDLISRYEIKNGYVISLLRYTFQRFNQERVPEAAASVAFYTIFSLFPMLLVLVATGSQILESAQAQEQILETILEVFPLAADTIRENIQQVLLARGSVEVLGALSLAWSASGMFTVLSRNLNRVWPNAEPQNVIIIRLRGLLILALLIVALLAYLLSNTVLRLLPHQVSDIASEAATLRFSPQLVIWFVLSLALLFLYRWMPNAKVRWKEAIWGAVIAAFGMEVATAGFTWFLSRGLITYNLVYGSLGAIVGLMFWIYFVSIIFLFGAHLSAAIAHYHLSSKTTS
jgi:membrane protein